MHGKVSKIDHEGRGLFAGLEGPVEGARYHSLIIDQLPENFVDTARCDGTLMGMSHEEFPLHGLQFHPESIATPQGKVLLGNFLAQAAAWNS